MVDKIVPPPGPRELLARLCVERSEDYARLSRLIGRNSAYVQQFISRGTPRRLPERERRILARHFGISERLLGADEDPAPAHGFVVPPALEGVDLEPVGVAFAADWLRGLDPEGVGRIRRLTISGEAMAPTLAPGDEVLADVGQEGPGLEDGLYVLRIEGRVQVRRLTFHPVRRQVTVQSDNPAFTDWPGLNPDELDVIGRVVWTGRRVG